MSKSQQLISILFEEPKESVSPGETNKRDVYRHWLWQVENAGGRVTKAIHPKLIKTVATALLEHWKTFEDSNNLVNLDNVRSKVRSIVNHGDYLHHCGDRLGQPDEADFLRSEIEWFQAKVDLRKENAQVKNPVLSQVSLI